MFITGLAVPTAARAPVPGKAPHDDGVHRIVGKLEQIAQNDRYGKAHQMARYIAARHVPNHASALPGAAAPRRMLFSIAEQARVFHCDCKAFSAEPCDFCSISAGSGRARPAFSRAGRVFGLH